MQPRTHARIVESACRDTLPRCRRQGSWATGGPAQLMTKRHDMNLRPVDALDCRGPRVRPTPSWGLHGLVMRSRSSSILSIVYVVIGVVVASSHAYFVHLT